MTSTKRSERRRTRALASLALVVAASALVAWLWRPAPPERSRVAPSIPLMAAVPTRLSPPSASPQLPVPAAAATQPIPAPANGSLLDLDGSASQTRLRHIQLRRRYPLWTQPLDPANVWQPPTAFQGSSSDQNPGGRIFVIAERPEADFGTAVRIFVTALDGNGRPAAIGGLEGYTAANWYGRTPHPRVDIAFGDDGSSGDDKASDLVYTGVLRLPADRANAGDWTVAVEGTIEGERRGASTSVLFVPSDARFTGDFSEDLIDGSLVVHAGVEIVRPAFTHVRLELFAGERPIAQAWAAQTPDAAGRRTFDVTFYGKVIRDAGMAGPFTVRHAILTTGGDDGRFPSPVVDPVLVTRPYPSEVFTDRDKNGGNLLLAEQERLALEDIEAAKHGNPGDQPQPRRMTLIDKFNTPIPE